MGIVCSALNVVWNTFCCGDVCCHDGMPYRAADYGSIEKVQKCLRLGLGREDIRVKTVSSEPMAVGEGNLSSMLRLTVTYHDPDQTTPVMGNGSHQRSPPERMIVKLAPRNFLARLNGKLFTFFLTECNFYTQGLCTEAGLQSPEVFFAHYAKSTDRFIIFMEDMSLRTSPPLYVKGHGFLSPPPPLRLP